MARLQAKYPGESEYLEAVQEVLESIEDVYNQHPEFEKARIVERMVEPDRIFTFRVTWVDDRGEVQTNTGYRVQFNSAIGPYKGGLRFHRAVSLSMLKFLGFEQTFKNALTTLPMGGAKGGSDFDPAGKSNEEIMRFCQAFMLELWNCIGPDQDIPAGDVGVGSREIGYLYGMYTKLARQYNTGVITGKGINWGGSILRPEATGYGALYFTQNLLARVGRKLEGCRIAVSGFGNVAWGACKKAKQLGAKVVAISGPDGVCEIPDGITDEMIDYMLVMRASNRNRVEDMADRFPGQAKFTAGRKAWSVKCDIALPCAFQNELDENDAKRHLVLLRGLQHGLPARRDPLFPAERRLFRPRQGRERRRSGHIRPGDDPERLAHQLGREGGRRQAALHHEVHPRRLREVRHPAGRQRGLR